MPIVPVINQMKPVDDGAGFVLVLVDVFRHLDLPPPVYRVVSEQRLGPLEVVASYYVERLKPVSEDRPSPDTCLHLGCLNLRPDRRVRRFVDVLGPGPQQRPESDQPAYPLLLAHSLGGSSANTAGTSARAIPRGSLRYAESLSLRRNRQRSPIVHLTPCRAGRELVMLE